MSEKTSCWSNLARWHSPGKWSKRSSGSGGGCSGWRYRLGLEDPNEKELFDRWELSALCPRRLPVFWVQGSTSCSVDEMAVAITCPSLRLECGGAMSRAFCTRFSGLWSYAVGDDMASRNDDCSLSLCSHSGLETVNSDGCGTRDAREVMALVSFVCGHASWSGGCSPTGVSTSTTFEDIGSCLWDSVLCPGIEIAIPCKSGLGISSSFCSWLGLTDSLSLRSFGSSGSLSVPLVVSQL